MTAKPTLLGYVGAVTGAAVSVKQAQGVASGISIIGGKSYRVGQVGSFVRIPQGYHDLYGIVAEVGANATPVAVRGPHDQSERWMTVQLVGEIVDVSFERGISQYPNINDEVHLVTEEDLAHIYGAYDSGQIVIGRLSSAEGIPVRIDLDKLITRHSAVLGATGAGKSTTVASLIRSIVSGGADQVEKIFPGARIVLIDIHGEYGRALKSISTVFRINPSDGEEPLHVPYWALDPADLMSFLMGNIEDKTNTQILDKIFDYMTKRCEASAVEGVDLTSMTVDTPIPYSLKKLWFELVDPEVKTWDDKDRTIPALVEQGDAATLKLPKYKPHSTGNSAPFINSVGVLGIRRQLGLMRSRLLDRQYDFLLHPGPWEPDLDGNVAKDIPDLLATWLGHERCVTILDLSGIPSLVLMRLIGAILKIICDSLFWGREKSEGGICRPVLIVMEEAHRYLSKDSDGPAKLLVQRVVKEGRKFGIGAMIISQRPSEVDETVLSQCGTFVSLRISNSSDRSKIQTALPDSLAGVVDGLPVLRTGEAIITGEAARLPIRCRITLPAEEHRPNSEDPEVSKRWQTPLPKEDYARVAASWRSQNPRWAAIRPERAPLPDKEMKLMEREFVESSSIMSIGYDASSETLEIEFKNGVYQYYNVPLIIYEKMMEASSKGQFFHQYIKNNYAFSRV
ncbi:MAG: helicase HerA domain-containing protein [Solidesulfovibrio sp. DCME]|uniref:helicase HerA domain-containing protein n=1 Tax=Solidesulfovibrio sp. DCME TaxID=3447380 RepID=UPI003D0C05F5